MREGDGEGAVGREVKLRVALAPVSAVYQLKVFDANRRCLLDNSDVDRRSGAGAVDLCVGHCD